MPKSLRTQLYRIIFESDTKAGRTFDLALIVCISLSVLTVILESIPSFSTQFQTEFLYAEWFWVTLFGIEYMLRIYSAKSPRTYIFSFYGLIDLLAILPSIAGIFFVGIHMFLVLRVLRLFRILRIFKLGKFLYQTRIIVESLRASKEKIGVFLFAVILLVLCMGTVMYQIEGAINEGFNSIPKSIYWCIVTLTTVGYGDIAPITTLGRFLASALMITGYAIIAVPTGIVSVEMAKQAQSNTTSVICSKCKKANHEQGAVYCNTCGKKL